MGFKHWAVALGIAAGGLVGCQKPPSAEDVAELEQVKAERAQLMGTLNAIETKVVVNEGLVASDTELRARHEQVSQVACSNMQEHWAGINRFLDNQREKARKHGERVASAERGAD